MKKRWEICMVGLILCCNGWAQPTTFAKLTYLTESFRPLPFGAIIPEGWIARQIRDNLAGFTGHLDSLAPDLIIADDIYGKDRLTRKIKKKDLGVQTDKNADQVQYLWWNSETQSNWWDGFIRSAILTGDQAAIGKASRYVERLLKTQDADGYLGIYDTDLRYRFDKENGELWAKTTLLRGLLAWYQYTRDPRVLQAIQRSVDEVMNRYPPATAKPFYAIYPDVGGLTHGLVFTDVLESLYQLTGRKAYLDYCLFLYADFSNESLHEDGQYAKLIDTAYRLSGHGVHTYEQVRAVAAAWYASGNPALQVALNGFLTKIAAEITPSGGPAGDEWIGRRIGDASTTGYEYCSLQELMNSYEDLLGKTGKSAFGDQAEHLFFNAAQGARNPEASCIAYLKTDNSYYMTGPLNGDTTQQQHTRYKYSPVHQDVAVCCVPNAGRIAPYYVQSMWMTDNEGLVATLLGPCSVHTRWRGTTVDFKERTDYPSNFTIDFDCTTGRPVAFSFRIRKPEWARTVSVSIRSVHSSTWAPVTTLDKEGYIVITRTWRSGNRIRFQCTPSLQVHHDHGGASYFTYGPLVLAHPLASKAVVLRRYALPGFYDYAYLPDSLMVYGYKGGGVHKESTGTTGFGSVQFHAALYNPGTGRQDSVLLVPMGGTILRQVTFR